MELFPYSTPRVWRGAIEWTESEGYWVPWRLPRVALANAHSPELVARARMPAGVRATFATEAETLTLRYRCDDESCSPFDVLIDGELAIRHATSLGMGEINLQMPRRKKVVGLWLPQFGQVALSALVLAGGEATALTTPRPKWITYGSSITQCRTARGPSATWPAQIARQRSWDLMCLGFGAQCHLDPVVARTIASMEADLISLCLGVNVFAASSFGPRSWPSQVTGFIQTIRDGHPRTPMVVITPIACPKYDKEVNLVGLTLEDVREGVAKACEVLQLFGDDNLYVVDGRELFGPRDCGLLDDGLHPTAEGYDLIAKRFGPRLEGVLESATAQ